MHMLVMAKTKGISLTSLGKTADSQRFKPQFKCQMRMVTTKPVFLPSGYKSLNSSPGTDLRSINPTLGYLRVKFKAFSLLMVKSLKYITNKINKNCKGSYQ